MADIKTRDVVKGTIKKIDKAAIAADRMRSAYVQTKEKAEHATYPDEHNAEEYASNCVNGVQWFKDRGQWIDGSAEPVPGMIIFFDWDNKGSSGTQDGQSYHTGIVQKVENGIVYTVEGNSDDSCRVNRYSVGHYEILVYGVPSY